MRGNRSDDIGKVLANASTPPTVAEHEQALHYRPYRSPLGSDIGCVQFFYVPMSAKAVAQIIADRDFQRRHKPIRLPPQPAPPMPPQVAPRIWTTEEVTWPTNRVYARRASFDWEPWVTLLVGGAVVWFWLS